MVISAQLKQKRLGYFSHCFFPFEAPFTCSICSNILDYNNYGGLRNFWSTPGWFLFPFLVFCLFPIGSMYGIYLHYIYHKKSTEYIGILNIYIYTIHGSYGFVGFGFWVPREGKGGEASTLSIVDVTLPGPHLRGKRILGSWFMMIPEMAG